MFIVVIRVMCFQWLLGLYQGYHGCQGYQGYQAVRTDPHVARGQLVGVTPTTGAEQCSACAGRTMLFSLLLFSSLPKKNHCPEH